MNGTYHKDFTSYLVLQRVALKTRQAYLNAVAGLYAFHEQPPGSLQQLRQYQKLLQFLSKPTLSQVSNND